MARKKTKKKKSGAEDTSSDGVTIKLIAENRKARHSYELIERIEAGLVLLGTEVKSARGGNVNLKDSYAGLRDGELYLLNVHITAYSHGTHENHDPLRPRKLLLHKRELRKWVGKITERGLTVVPTRMYFKNGKIKVELALARGKRQHDKRAAARERDMERDVKAALKERSR